MDEQQSPLTFRKAVRQAVPMVMSIAGVSGSGKTYSALLIAAGIAGDKGRVGFIDTENGRGSMYADSPGIKAALPQGFEILDLPAPFSPGRYIEAIDAAEAAGINVLVIDSGSHEWEGTGGCAEMAEKDKGRWNRAKLANKRYVYRLLYSTMHVIVCLRAREKSKIIPKEQSASKKEEYISLGVLPIAEKNFVFEMLLSLQLDEKTHAAIPVKVPEPLLPLFPGGRVITKADGERIRLWNETGVIADPGEQLAKRARAAAEDGMRSYKAFFETLTPAQKKSVTPHHAANKAIAEAADREAVSGEPEDVEAKPDPVPLPEGFRVRYQGKLWQVAHGEDQSTWIQVQ